MLKAKGEIMFTLEESNYVANDHFRVAFSFGDGLLFSGMIKSDNEFYDHGKSYQVNIEFFTIEDEAYELIKSCLQAELETVMCAGSRILGLAKLFDFTYKNQNIPILV
ncbi:MAG: hypothetical protein LBD23_16955 [Oscillospiraceae bacterium]|jgi:hypothetical protein|nr:hypothetical protein [Oscillospiraceae bacterium]